MLVKVLRASANRPSLCEPIFLIGPTHVGKSHHGKKLSEYFHYEFVDLDVLIENNAGVDIQTIFDFEGEQGFRDREHKALASIDTHSPTIVATGAGIILRQDNREQLQKGMVIYLGAPVELLLSRVKEKSNRPLFHQQNPQQVLEEMHRIRTPLYEQCADYKIMVNQHSTTAQISTAIINFIKSKEK